VIASPTNVGRAAPPEAARSTIEHDRVEVVHEALFTGWPRLVEWRRAHQEGARLRDQLAEAARQWHERGRPRGLLWRDDALAEYRAWRRRWPEKPTALELAFGVASEREARRVRRRRIGILVAIAAALVTGIVVLYRLDRRAEAERESAERQKRVLLGEQARAELAADHAGRALPYLAAALREGEDTPSNRLLVAEASRPFLAEIATITDFREGILGFAWSRDGSRFVATGQGTLARIYDRDGTPLLDLAGHAGAMWSGGFDATGTHVVTASGDNTARVWDAATGTAVVIHADPPMHHAQFDPSGNRVLVAGGAVRIHDARTGAVVATVADFEAYDAAFSPDGTRVAVADITGNVELRDAATGKLVHRFTDLPGSLPRAVRFSRDGSRLYTPGPDKVVRVWDTTSFAPIAVLAGHTAGVEVADISAGDRFVATISGGDPVKLWDARANRLIAELAGHATGVIRSAQFSADGTRLVSTASDNTHRIWDLATLRVQRILEDPGAVGSAPHSISGAFVAVFSPDGSRLVTGSGATLRLWRTGKEPLVAELRSPLGVLAGVLSPDEKQVAVSGGQGYAAIWSLATGEQLLRLAIPRLATQGQSLWDVSWSPDGKRLVVAGDDGYAQVFAVDGTVVATLAGHIGAINHASFSPDGTKIVTSCDDHTARVWDAATGKQLLVLAGHTHRVISAAWSRDGTTLATAGYDRSARIWDVATGREQLVLDDSTTQVMDLAFDPSGHRIACAGHDGQAWVWDLRTRARVVALVGHNASVTGIAWSPDGSLIATSGGEDETIRVWDADSGKLLAHRDQPGTPMEVAWSHDSQRVLASGGELIRLWDFHRDERSVDAIVDFVAARAPWRLVDGRLELASR
jgi:WD40 repeat protein